MSNNSSETSSVTSINQEADDVEKGDFSNEKEQLEEPQDSSIVGWDGPDDPENPLNWSPVKKNVAIAIVSILTLLSPIASTMISTGVADVMKEFQSTSQILGSFVTTAFVIGYASGPLVVAPLSELYGRLIVYETCAVLFVIWNVACALSNNLAALIIFRLFAGIAGSCPVTIGAGSIADMVPRQHRGLAMSAWTLGPLFGPSIGPIAGGYLAPAAGWRWIFWVLSIAGGVTAVMTFLFMKESCHYVILERKTKRLRKETGKESLRSALDNGKTPKQLFAFSILRPLKMLVLSPIVFLLSLYIAIVYSYLYLCFTTFPRIFESQYGFSSGEAGLAYLGIGVGSMVGLAFCGAVSDRVVLLLTKKNGGDAKPEYRLPTMTFGAFLVPIGLFWYGWTAQEKTHWILPIIGTSFLGAGMIVAFMACSTYLVDAFTSHAASAMAANTVLRSLFAAFLPLAGEPMYNALDVGWGTSVLGFISVAFLPLPFLFYIYGERIRESKLFRVEF